MVAPTRSHAHALKARLLEKGQSNLGIHFVTPAGLRDLLAGASDRALPLREHLRLLLAIAAEETLRESTEKELNADELAAKAVGRAPDHLLRTLDRLETAGWNFESLQLPSFQPIVRRFREQLRACGFSLVAQFDREVLTQATSRPPIFANVLIAGFDAAHWPHWFLLRAAVEAAENATVVLEYPREDLSSIDACWIGSWEEALGEATPVFSPANPANEVSDSLFSEAEMQGSAVRAANRSFIVGADTSEQSQAIALTCLRFLAEKNCDRVGVVFANAGSLPRLVASELSKLAVPHNDGFGHPVPGLFESAEWRAWLHLQRGPRVNSLLRFFSALQSRERLFPEISFQTFDRILRSAHSDVLIDDITLLQKFCAAQSGQKMQEVANALQLIQFLPARGSLSEFLQATGNAFARLGWKQHWMEVASRSSDWTGKVETEFSRTLYLRWLEDIASTFSAGRDTAGDHPYARVQLLTIAQAQGQEWSHLIFAGLNEGSWPPAEKGEFAREEEIEKFNRGIQQLNRRAAKQGSQGEGHTSVRENHSLYLGPSEQRQIALRQFQTLLESASEGIAIGASLVQESAPDRFWNPSELLARLYQETRHRALTQATMNELQRATAAWLQTRRAQIKPAAPQPEDVSQTRIAYDARRDPAEPSGAYDFALRSPKERIPILSVSEFEALLKSPAIVWLKKYLGVEGAEDETNPWSAATGQWVHRWLANVAGEKCEAAPGGTSFRSPMDVQKHVPPAFVRLPNAAGIDQRIRAAAEEKCAEIEQLCQSAGKQVPDWWGSGWQNAFCLARVLGAKLATVEGWPWMAAEWKIEGEEPLSVTANAPLLFRGRIDLLLARHECHSLETDELWILDYKTGASKKALAPAREDTEKRKSQLHKKILDGSALQLGLYGFAARQFGAGEVFLSLLSPAVKPVVPQLSVADMEAEAEIFQELGRMQQTGVFGMRGPLRSPWTFTRDYPLAILAVDNDILEQRWELTHPALAKEEEDFYW